MHQNLSVNSSTPSVIRSTQPTSSSKPDIEFDTNTCHQVLPLSDDFKAQALWKHVHLVSCYMFHRWLQWHNFESNGSLLFDQGSLWSSTSKTCEISCADARVVHHRWVTKPIQTQQRDRVTKQTCLMWILKSNIEWQCMGSTPGAVRITVLMPLKYGIFADAALKSVTIILAYLSTITKCFWWIHTESWALKVLRPYSSPGGAPKTSAKHSAGAFKSDWKGFQNSFH